jgi:hypothetical protein
MADEPITFGAPASPPFDSFSLGQRLIELKRHPVLLFGTTAAGKTNIIMSLLRALKAAQIDVRLGQQILPPSHPDAAIVHGNAREIVERKYEAFVHGREIRGTTEVAAPFFIPLDLQRSDESEPVRLAIMEGKGEWYEPSGELGGSLYQGLKREVVDVLSNYSDPITVVFVAPYAFDGHDGTRQRNSDIGLTGAIQAYRDARGFGSKDSLLFLLTKWDVFANPRHENPAFATVRGEQVRQLLSERYPDSWNAFQAIPRPLESEGRWFMQYVSAFYGDSGVAVPPRDLAPLFERYPKTLANWIYGNATRETVTLSSGELHSREKVLFGDVIEPGPVEISILRRPIQFLLRRVRR